MKTAIYMRVGNKEQLNPPSHENRIPTPEELAAEGYEVLTLPKKKAWLYIRHSVPMSETLQANAIADLETFAKEMEYEVIGSTVLIGSQQESIAELTRFVNTDPPAQGADAILIQNSTAISRKYDEVKEIYDAISDKGVTLLFRDGGEEMFEDETPTMGMGGGMV